MTILFDQNEALPHTTRALALLGWTLASRADSSVDKGQVGLIVWWGETPESFFEPFGRLWDTGIRRFVLLAPGMAKGTPWDDLPPLQSGAFRESFTICSEAGGKPLAAAMQIARKQTARLWAERRIQSALESRRLQRLLSAFGHSTPLDLSNQFLAPARLQTAFTGSMPAFKDWPETWAEVWKKFSDSVLTQIPDGRYGSLGDELDAAAQPLATWRKDPNAPAPTPRDLSRLMQAITECRVASGEHARPSPHPPVGASHPAPLRSPERTNRFRVLVVDDHASAWRPVFELLQSALARDGKNVDFEFASDPSGHVSTVEGGSVPVQYVLYDLVILDVFLSTSHDGHVQDGLHILKQIRQDTPNLPVLLWTTSRDADIAAAASFANGVLFKKTIEWPDLRNRVGICLSPGRSKRASSLPSPFFNHTILDPKYRALVRDFYDWCLKQLDSFHALDGSYFRYFTDHGGRHIVKLLELLEHALQPFLVSADSSVLPLDPDERQFELLVLCLAVVCHELGMFPMKSGPIAEDFSRLGDDYLNDVRTLHALRGMALLWASVPGNTPSRHYWIDDEGALLGRGLDLPHPNPAHKGVRLSDMLATVVGYHSRFLKKLDADTFLKWPKDVADEFTRLTSPTVTLSRADAVFSDVVASLDHALKDPGLRARLRRQCALFRFVDAIDITSTRNPAQFLLLDMQRDEANNREYLKRQLCKSITINSGEVSAHMRVPWPTDDADGSELETILKKIVAACEKFDLPKRDICREAGDLLSRSRDRLLRPWNDPATTRLHVLRKPLDEWLLEMWRVLMGLPAKDGFVEHLVDLKILDRPRLPRVSPRGRRLIATITALSVAWEVIDEYEAIGDAGLSDSLRLGVFEGDEGDRSGWTTAPTRGAIPSAPTEASVPPPELSILGVGLDQYAIGRRS